MSTIDFMGSSFKCKDFPCDLNGTKQQENALPYINLYVRLTNFCARACPFCIFGQKTDVSCVDRHKLIYTLLSLSKVVEVRKVSFTGGEPATYQWLGEVVNLIKQINKNIFVVVNTAKYGIGENERFIENVDSISFSVHHYLPDQNAKLFGGKSSSFSYLKGCGFKEKAHISCNLVKGYIDSPDEMYNYMSYFSNMGFKDFGFVGLMKVNEFCNANFVDTVTIHNQLLADPRFRQSRKYNLNNSCICANYLVDCNSIPTMYMRQVLNMHCCNQSMLVYDTDNTLKQGFNGKIIASI